MGQSEPPVPERVAELDADEVRRRSVSGAAIFTVQGIGSRLLALFGSVAIARTLAPEDLGVVAFGNSIFLVVSFLADAGIGAALLRERTEPRREDLAAVLAAQLAGSVALVVLICAVALPFGRVGAVTAAMAAVAPLVALRTPAYISLEWSLSFRPLVVTEFVDTVVYYSTAVVLALVGFGAWALVIAAVARGAAGSVTLLALHPPSRLRPKWNAERLRRLLGFGLQYQAIGLASLVRDQGLNLGIGVVAGLGSLGLWDLAKRILQVPFLLFTTLWRVSFPAMARLHEEREQGRAVLATAGMVAVVAALILVPIGSSSPALASAVFGERWTAVTEILPWACVGLLISGPVSVSTAGVLLAAGRADQVLVATVLSAGLWLGAAIPLLPLVGIKAVGIGWLVSAIAEAHLLSTYANRLLGVGVVGQVARVAALGVVSGAVGLGVGSVGGTEGAVGSVAAATAVLVLLLMCFRRGTLVRAWSLGMSAVGISSGR